MQPRGDSIYLTGSNLAHLPKRLWTADQPGQDNDQPLRVECPDTILGRASRALLLGNLKEARNHLQRALKLGIAPNEVRMMLRELAVQTRPAAQRTDPSGSEKAEGSTR
jgi:hypothetical protein